MFKTFLRHSNTQNCSVVPRLCTSRRKCNIDITLEWRCFGWRRHTDVSYHRNCAPLVFDAGPKMQELLDYWPLKMGLIGFPETSERNYNYSLHNSPEERSPHLLRGGSLRNNRNSVWCQEGLATFQSEFHISPSESQYQGSYWSL